MRRFLKKIFVQASPLQMAKGFMEEGDPERAFIVLQYSDRLDQEGVELLRVLREQFATDSAKGDGPDLGRGSRPEHFPAGSDQLAKPGSTALSDAQKRRTGLRGWKSSKLQWEVQHWLWDDELKCYVVGIAARPHGQPEALQVEWEYWLNEKADVLPGYPVVKNIPTWGRAGWDQASGAAGPSKRDRRLTVGSLAVAAAIVIGSLGWLAIGLPANERTTFSGEAVTLRPTSAPPPATMLPLQEPPPATPAAAEPASSPIPAAAATIQKQVSTARPLAARENIETVHFIDSTGGSSIEMDFTLVSVEIFDGRVRIETRINTGLVNIEGAISQLLGPHTLTDEFGTGYSLISWKGDYIRRATPVRSNSTYEGTLLFHGQPPANARILNYSWTPLWPEGRRLGVRFIIPELPAPAPAPSPSPSLSRTPGPTPTPFR